MNKELIYEVFYETISESVEWWVEDNMKTDYSTWVDGAVMMTSNLLCRLKDTDKNSKCSCPAEKTYSYSGEK